MTSQYTNPFNNNLIDVYPWRVRVLRSLKPHELYGEGGENNEIVASDIFCVAASKCHIAVGFANGLIRLLSVSLQQSQSNASQRKSSKAVAELILRCQSLPADSSAAAHDYAVNAVHFVPSVTHDTSILVSCSRDGTAAMWDVSTARRVCSLSHPSGQSIRSCCVSFDGSLMATAGDDQYASLWLVGAMQRVGCTRDHDSSVTCCAISPSARTLVTGTSDGDLFAWHIASGGDAKMPMAGSLAPAHDLGVTCAAFAPAGENAPSGGAQLLVSGGQDNLVKVWWLAESHSTTKVSWKLRHACTGHEQSIMCIAVDHKGTMLASGGGDKIVIVWDLCTGAPLCRLTAHSRYITCVSLLARGQFPDDMRGFGGGKREPCALLLAGSNDKTLTLSALYDTGVDDSVSKIDVKVVSTQSVQSKPAKNINRQRSSTSTSSGCAAKLRNDDGSLPDEFYCPITREVMAEPVVAADGHSYERAAISNWVAAGKRHSPMNGAPLSHLDMTDNLTLRCQSQTL